MLPFFIYIPNPRNHFAGSCINIRLRLQECIAHQGKHLDNFKKLISMTKTKIKFLIESV